jgi:hypothetical protein
MIRAQDRPRLLFLTACFVMLCVALFVLADPACHIPYTTCSNDADHYGYRVALAFLRSGWFVNPYAAGEPWVFWPPGFAVMYMPIILAGAAKPLVVMTVVQIVLLYLVAIMAYHAAILCFGTSGLLAFGLTAFNPLLLAAALVPQADMPYAAALSASILCALRFMKRGNTREILLIGICLTVASYLRPGAFGLIFLMPLVLPLLAVLSPSGTHWARTFAWSAISAAIALALLSPWLVRQNELGQGFRMHGLVTETELVLDSLDYLDPEHVGAYHPSGLTIQAREAINTAVDRFLSAHPDAGSPQIERIKRDAAKEFALSGVVPPIDAAVALWHGLRRFAASGGEGFLHKLLGIDRPGQSEPATFMTIKALSLGFAIASRILGVIGVIWLVQAKRWDIVFFLVGLILTVWAGTPVKGGPRYRIPVEIPFELLAVAGWLAVNRTLLRGQRPPPSIVTTSS